MMKNELLKKGETLQLFILRVGEKHNLTNIYVCVDDTRFAIESPLKAVDICLKIYHALHAHYPTQCINVWNFLQRYVYKIFSKFDVKSSNQETVATELCIAEPELRY